MSKKVFLLELNEFNTKLLEEKSKELQLKNIQRVLAMHRCSTFTEDTYDSNFLEPWVQWVSVHTGQPSSVHQIKHLGDIPHGGIVQIWERLAEKKVTSGIWCAMNAHRNGVERCLFFLPDPWTASENAYPKALNKLLNPLRYVSKNYLKRSFWTLSKQSIQLLGLFFSYHLIGKILKEIPHILRAAMRFKGAYFVLISAIEYISTLLFLKYREQYNPDFSLLFINGLAHLQHHHWTKKEPIAYGLKYVDRIFGEIFSQLGSEDILIVTNALSQQDTAHEVPWILYRQYDQNAFLKRVGISYKKIEAHMTHDAHLLFHSAAECVRAKELLEGARICGKSLFLVEAYPKEPTKLFYRICFTDHLDPKAIFTLGDRSFRFFDLFQRIVQRTGKHIPQGTLYTNANFPKNLKNHEIYTHIVNLF